jgi:hypothetical protein
MTRGYRSWFQNLINVWTMPATMLKNKVMYKYGFGVLVVSMLASGSRVRGFAGSIPTEAVGFFPM